MSGGTAGGVEPDPTLAQPGALDGDATSEKAKPDDDAMRLLGNDASEFSQIPDDPVAAKNADAAKWLAMGLLIALGSALVIHYIALLYLATIASCSLKENPALEAVSQALNAWLPALTGLLGSAGTYYFTRKS